MFRGKSLGQDLRAGFWGLMRTREACAFWSATRPDALNFVHAPLSKKNKAIKPRHQLNASSSDVPSSYCFHRDWQPYRLVGRVGAGAVDRQKRDVGHQHQPHRLALRLQVL